MTKGNPGESSWSLLRITVPPESAELIVDELLARGAAAVEEIASDDETVVLRTSLGDDSEIALRDLRDLLDRFPGVGITTEHVPRAVADSWREHVENVQVDEGLWLVPAWLVPPADANAVLVEPFDTFGLGNHPTTVMALRLARRFIPHGARVHDHGTGSGVIAIAMTATHGCRMSVDDIHPGSRAAVRYNARLNEVREPEWCDGLPVGPVDAVVANILAPVLRDHADSICRAVAPGGLVVLAGLRMDQYEDVVGRYGSCEVIATEETEGWIAVALRK